MRRAPATGPPDGAAPAPRQCARRQILANSRQRPPTGAPLVLSPPPPLAVCGADCVGETGGARTLNTVIAGAQHTKMQRTEAQRRGPHRLPCRGMRVGFEGSTRRSRSHTCFNPTQKITISPSAPRPSTHTCSALRFAAFDSRGAALGDSCTLEVSDSSSHTAVQACSDNILRHGLLGACTGRDALRRCDGSRLPPLGAPQRQC
jgi:hypothetical protein